MPVNRTKKNTIIVTPHTMQSAASGFMRCERLRHGMKAKKGAVDSRTEANCETAPSWCARRASSQSDCSGGRRGTKTVMKWMPVADAMRIHMNQTTRLCASTKKKTVRQMLVVNAAMAQRMK